MLVIKRLIFQEVGRKPVVGVLCSCRHLGDFFRVLASHDCSGFFRGQNVMFNFALKFDFVFVRCLRPFSSTNRRYDSTVTFQLFVSCKVILFVNLPY